MPYSSVSESYQKHIEIVICSCQIHFLIDIFAKIAAVLKQVQNGAPTLVSLLYTILSISAYGITAVLLFLEDH